MKGSFAGRVVAVTGSGRERGLGAAILAAFAREGADCVVSDIGHAAPHMSEGDIGAADEMERVTTALRAFGVRATSVVADVRRTSDCAALVDKAVTAFGRLDILVNNAGIGYIMKPLIDVVEDEWDAVLDVNLKGAFLATQAVARHMIARGEGGRIINIASQAAKSGFPHMAPYCASKHGMIGLTRSNAVELGRHGITVNAVCPNHVTTGLGERQNAYFSDLLGFDSEAAYLADMAARNPMRRAGLTTDTAAACLWLASDAAGYITGEALNVSGGEEMH